MKPAKILLCLFFSTSINAQVNITNLSLTDTTQNIFYVGVDNFIKISGKQYDPLKQTITIMGGGATISGLNGSYNIKVQSETDSCQMWIRENGKLIFKKNFICRKIGDPLIRFSSRYDSIAKDGYTYFITYENLIRDPVFRITLPNCYFKNPWKFVSYRITLDSLPGNETISEFMVSGPEPTNEQIKIIKNYGTDTFMTLDEIRAIGPDGRTRKLTPMIFYIK